MKLGGKTQRIQNLEKGREKSRRKKRMTERTFLRDMLAIVEKDPGLMKRVIVKTLADAAEGNKDARDFVGKYLLGGGKVPLDEVYHAPLIRKSR